MDPHTANGIDSAIGSRDVLTEICLEGARQTSGGVFIHGPSPHGQLFYFAIIA